METTITQANLVTAGRVGMWLNLNSIEGDPDFAVAIAPPPFSDGLVSRSNFAPIGLYISAQTPNPVACWTWLNFLSNEIPETAGSFPARKSLATSPAFLDHARAGAADVYTAYQAAFTKGVTMGVDPYQVPMNYFWLMRAIDHALQGKDLANELEVAQKTTEQYLVCLQNNTPASVCATQVDPSYTGITEK